MIGENKIQYNQTTMCQAIETYLKEHVMMNKDFEVTEVKADKDNFVIIMKETEGKKPDEILNQRG